MRKTWRVLATLVGLSLACPAALRAQTLNVYFGNLHSHTSYSDGSATPEDAYQHARDVARVDFLAITEHNHAQAGRIAGDHELYSGNSSTSLKSTANRFTVNGTFVALYGQEFSTIKSGNHANVFEVSDVIETQAVPNGSYDALLKDWLPNHLDSTGQPAVLLLNHPATSDSPNAKEYGRDDFGGVDSAWIEALDARARLINIINGPSHEPGTGLKPGKPSESEFLRYLNLGFHLAPTADQDNHTRNWGNATEARTAVLATELTKPAILEALRARRVYASEDRNLRVIARINGNLIGSRVSGAGVPAAGSELAISVEIRDDDEPSATYEVFAFSDQPGGAPADVAGTATGTGNGIIQVTGVRYNGGNQYVFLRITQSDDDGVKKDCVWTAPVWFEPAAPAPVPVTGFSLSVDLLREEAVVTNLGTAPADFTGWSLVSLQGNQVFQFPKGFKLAPGAAVTVTSGPAARQQPPEFLRWTTSNMWANGGDPGELRDASGAVVASTP